MSGRLAAALVAGTVVALLVAGSGAGTSSLPITTCGQTVTTNAVLTQNLICPGDGVVVGASGVTIDLHGFTIRGNGSLGHYGINDVSGYGHVAIKNGALTDFGYGVFVPNTADHITLSGLAVTGSPGYGIEIVGTSPSVSSTTASGNAGYGIYLDGASASVSSSVAAGNGYSGIYIYGASASIKSSVATGNSAEGIVVFGDAPRLKGDRTNGNGFAGFTSDDLGLGIDAGGYTTAPVGTNTAVGNDDSTECFPTSLC